MHLAHHKYYHYFFFLPTFRLNFNFRRSKLFLILLILFLVWTKFVTKKELSHIFRQITCQFMACTSDDSFPFKRCFTYLRLILHNNNKVIYSNKQVVFKEFKTVSFSICLWGLCSSALGITAGCFICCRNV